MRFQGIQKTTLLDFPGKVACTLFTAGCNLRCPFCHNAFLVTEINPDDGYEEGEIIKFLSRRKNILDGVAITGGEPLLTDDIFPFIEKIRKMGYAIKLDTNGTFPNRLKRAIEEGLVDYVAMDVKNTKEKYAQTVGFATLNYLQIQESIEYLKESSVDYEFRTTVVKAFHTAEDIQKIATELRGAKRYFLQNFVDSGNLILPGVEGVDRQTMKEYLAIAKQVLPVTELRGID